MAISLVQSKGATGVTGATATVSGLTATTAGNLLVMLVSAAKNPGDVTFTPPANWVQAGLTVHNNVFISISTAIYYYPNNPGGITSVATTLSSAPSAWHMYILEFSGIATTSPLDAEAMQEQDHTTTPTSGLVTTTASGDLLVGWSEVDDNNGTYTITQPAGWTGLTQLDDVNGWSSTFPAWDVAGAAGSYQYQPTKSNSVTDGTFAIAAFLAAAGGGGTPLTAQAGLMVLNPPAAATLTVAVALQGQAGKGVLITPSATLAVAVALTAQSNVGVLIAPSATLAVAVALQGQSGTGVLIAPNATLAVAVALQAQLGLGVLIGSNAQISLGGQLTAQAGLMTLTQAGSPATLLVAVALVEPTPAVMVMPLTAATLLVALALQAQLGLAALLLTNAQIAGVSIIGSCVVSDAALASVTLADALAQAGSVTLSDASLGSVTLADIIAEGVGV